MDVVLEIQKLKEELVQEIDGKIEQIIEQLRTNRQTVSERENILVREYEIIFPLNAGTGIYKGKRPTRVTFAGGERVESPT